MKKAVFIEMEGLLTPFNDYVPDSEKVNDFVKQLSSYCKDKKIALYLISGYHGEFAKQKFEESVLEKYFSKSQFIYVHDEYINDKADADRELHKQKLEKDPGFNDSYFKQVEIKKFLEKESLAKDELLLLSDDVWVDGFYTMKFSGVDFAICEENITERGNPTERIPGLAYFSLDFESVKVLIEDFPEVDTSLLEKFVFKKMSEVLMQDVDFSELAKKAADKKLSGLDSTQINMGE